jgi:hypothetical protein
MTTMMKCWLIAFLFKSYIEREKEMQFTCHEDYGDDKCIHIEQERQKEER